MTAVIWGVLFFISALLYLSVLMGKSKSCGGRGGSLYLGQFNFRLNCRQGRNDPANCQFGLACYWSEDLSAQVTVVNALQTQVLISYCHWCYC